ncbi:hypothetical protein L211DRAFT_850359 [Terfezia boudieri ATCC MYA-4762]|uniref:Uncharacterized protein n=1 Tax=Terfezia boudieri ATCC MYA-4762 TaxID=1051890 RepID=A0A3N4LQN8_9PEZI|nr:hypothetical protein L211DRAFT_850359 [Terfezia boudieri ATCC MYA-4762]
MPQFTRPITNVMWGNATTTVPTHTPMFTKVILDLPDEAIEKPLVKPPVWTIVLITLVIAACLLGAGGILWAAHRAKAKARRMSDAEEPLESTDAYQLPPLNLNGPNGRDSFNALVEIANNSSASSIPFDPVHFDATRHSPRPSSSLYSRPLTDFAVSYTSNSPHPTRPVSVVSNGSSRAADEHINPTPFGSYRRGV